MGDIESIRLEIDDDELNEPEPSEYYFHGPLDSASEYKKLSDRIEQGQQLAGNDLQPLVSADEALRTLNTTLYTIDPRLVLAGIGKALTFRTPSVYTNPDRSHSIRGREPITPGMLATPDSVYVQHDYWDLTKRVYGRRIPEGQGPPNTFGYFEDEDHVDYSRRLGIGFIFNTGPSELNLQYSIMRSQEHQSQPAQLDIHAATGVDYGEYIERFLLTTEQESAFIGVLHPIIIGRAEVGDETH